ncbi:MAG: tRNA threonylcarbamoyladenosine dehydratase [Anaerovoracaceae bacterium]|nr:tRNA threonylcarbamoyladenosine dehydratase [Anaerovoracaceae bacterium]
MTYDGFEPLERIVGKEGIKLLNRSRVMVVGLGGVGSSALEALSRSGIGTLGLVDGDQVDISNLNRQVLALNSTLGMSKVQVMKSRILDIYPQAQVITFDKYYLAENSQDFSLDEYDYIVDAIDSMASKIHLIRRCQELKIPLVSSMGMANKWDPTRLEIGDIYDTSVCPLAKVLRKELKALGVKGCKVVYSKEPPLKLRPPGSTAFVPPVAGMIMASIVVGDLLGGLGHEG